MNARQYKRWLATRLCRYLGLTLTVERKGRVLEIMLWPSTLDDKARSSRDVAIYHSWKELLFGSDDSYGLNEISIVSHDEWRACEEKMFHYGSLEELELTLDVLGV